MPTRRTVLGLMGVGAVALSVPAREARAAFVDGGPSHAAPWGLLAPLSQGSNIGGGWSIASLGKIERGAAVLELGHHDGRIARLHLCAHQGAPRGLAHTEAFDLVLMDGGQGDQATPEGLARAIQDLARRIRSNERADAGAARDEMLSHDQRVARYPADTLL